MKRYEVKITDKALADMEEIYRYIDKVLQAPDTAMRKYDRIADEIQSLELLPMRCKLFDSQPEHDLGMRQLLIDKYCAIYVVEDPCVTVLRVLYSASDLIARLRNS